MALHCLESGRIEYVHCREEGCCVLYIPSRNEDAGIVCQHSIPAYSFTEGLGGKCLNQYFPTNDERMGCTSPTTKIVPSSWQCMYTVLPRSWQLLLLFWQSFNCVSSTQDCALHCVEVGNLWRQADAKQTTNRTAEKYTNDHCPSIYFLFIWKAIFNLL